MSIRSRGGFLHKLEEEFVPVTIINYLHIRNVSNKFLRNTNNKFERYFNWYTQSNFNRSKYDPAKMLEHCTLYNRAKQRDTFNFPAEPVEAKPLGKNIFHIGRRSVPSIDRIGSFPGRFKAENLYTVIHSHRSFLYYAARDSCARVSHS